MTSSSSPTELNTIAGRLATFDTPHQLPKRRASSTKKKAVTQVSWPHETPTPADVTIPIDQSTVKRLLTRFSLHEQGSTTSPPPVVPTASHVICARRHLTDGTLMTTPPSNISLMFQTVDGQSMSASSSARMTWIARKKIH